MKYSHSSKEPCAVQQRTARLLRTIKKTEFSRKCLRRYSVLSKDNFIIRQQLSTMVKMHFKESLLHMKVSDTYRQTLAMIGKLDKIYQKRLLLQDCDHVPTRTTPHSSSGSAATSSAGTDLITNHTYLNAQERTDYEMDLVSLPCDQHSDSSGSSSDSSSDGSSTSSISYFSKHLTNPPRFETNVQQVCSRESHEPDDDMSSASNGSFVYEDDRDDPIDHVTRVISFQSMPSPLPSGRRERNNSCSSLSMYQVKELLTSPIDSEHETDWSNAISSAVTNNIPRSHRCSVVSNAPSLSTATQSDSLWNEHRGHPVGRRHSRSQTQIFQADFFPVA